MNIKGNSKYYIGLILLGLAFLIFIYNDSFLYTRPLCKIISVHTETVNEKTGFDGKQSHKEKYYKQVVKGVLLNGSDKGKEVFFTNNYSESQVYDSPLAKGQRVFIDNIHKNKTQLYGSFSGLKRDFYIALPMILMFLLFAAFGKKKGLLTILSLFINIAVFYLVVILYLKGINILALTIPMVLIFTMMLLIFMYGHNYKTYLSFISTCSVLLIIGVLTVITVYFAPAIDYDFMDYLQQPYEPHDAYLIYISQTVICSMGAVTDVVVTVIITLDQVALHKKNTIETREIFKICQNIGDSIVGTMISIMFFTTLAVRIPFFILSMRNGISFLTCLKYHSFFEISRFLSGSIAIVIAIPVSAVIASFYFRRHKEERQC